MKDSQFHRFDSACGGSGLNYRVTLREASKTNDATPKYCLDSGYASNITALHLEKLINEWMDIAGRLERKEPAPTTVDALYVCGDKFFFIEFKRNEVKTLNAMKAKLLEKIYDSVLQVVEHNLRTVADVRKFDSYIVVAKKVNGRTDDDFRMIIEKYGIEGTGLFEMAINGVDNSLLLRPWMLDPPPVDANLDHVNTVLYKTALTLTPVQFNLYAQEHGWH